MACSSLGERSARRAVRLRVKEIIRTWNGRFRGNFAQTRKPESALCDNMFGAMDARYLAISCMLVHALVPAGPLCFGQSAVCGSETICVVVVVRAEPTAPDVPLPVEVTGSCAACCCCRCPAPEPPPDEITDAPATAPSSEKSPCAPCEMCRCMPPKQPAVPSTNPADEVERICALGPLPGAILPTTVAPPRDPHAIETDPDPPRQIGSHNERRAALAIWLN